MKSRHLLSLIAFGAITLVGTGCQPEVKLNELDTHVELEEGIAIPVGSMKFSIYDFFGKGQVPNLVIDTLGTEDGYGVLAFQDTFPDSRKYHPLDLSKYLSEANETLNVYDKIQATEMIGTNKKVTGDGSQTQLDFDITMKLKGINDPDSIANERLDSALIATAKFYSTITRQDLPLEWEWIDQVSIELMDQFHRASGKTIIVYPNSEGKGGYSQEIPIDVDKFSINLMKNKNPQSKAAADKNIVNEVKFKIHFKFTIPSGKVVQVPEDAAFKYKFGVRFMTYEAVWGWFKPSNDMHSGDVVVDIAEEWSTWKQFENARLPFKEPRVDAKITTHIAGWLEVAGGYLYTQDKEGNKQYATFNQSGSTNLTYRFAENEILPLTSQIGDSTTNMHIYFDKDVNRGHIDNLFKLTPQKLGYMFDVNFDSDKAPYQIRITNNTDIRIDAIATLPFYFNQGVTISYSDTIKDINISSFSIDSLTKNIECLDTLKAEKLNLALNVKNDIPLTIHGIFHFFDELGNEMFFTPGNDTLHIEIAPPTFVEKATRWEVGQPSSNPITLELNQAQINQLPKLKAVVFVASVDDDSFKEYYSKAVPFKQCKITRDNSITVKIGVSTKAGAIIDLGKLGNNDKK